MCWCLSQSVKRLIHAALTLSISVVAYSQEATSTLDATAAETRKAGIAEYRLGNFVHAEFLLRRALEHAERNNDVYDAALNRVALADIYQAQGLFPKAEEIYEGAISVFRQTKQVHALAITLRNLAAVRTAQQKYKESIRHLEEASMLAKTIVPRDFELELRILDTFGLTYFKQGKIDKAQDCFKRAIDAASTLGLGIGNMADVNRGQILNNLASMYEYKQRYREAEDTYIRALRVTEEQFGRIHPQFVNTLDNLGYFYLNTGRHQEAEVQFRQSLAIAERGNLGFDDVLIRTLHGLGKIHMKRNEDEQAEAALSRAIGIVRGSAGNRTEAAEVLETYSRLLLDEARRIRVTSASTINIRTGKHVP